MLSNNPFQAFLLLSICARALRSYLDRLLAEGSGQATVSVVTLVTAFKAFQLISTTSSSESFIKLIIPRNRAGINWE